MIFKLRKVVKTRQRDKGYRLLVKALTIEANAKVALTGPSGCGKSTTLDLLGLSLAPDSADEFIFAPEERGIAIMRLWQEHEYDALASLRLDNLGYVLQSGELLPYLSVGENMTLTARLAGVEKSKATSRARDLAAQLGIDALWQAMPETLSVGERQRAAIVRAMTSQPRAILADEPTAALDSIHAESVMRVFLECIAESRCALVLVTHNPAWAASGGFQEVGFTLREDDDGVTAILDDNSQ